MKKLILIILAAAFLASCSTYKAQYVNGIKIPPMVPFSKFKGDTAAYLKQNIENRKQYYIGKKFKVLLDDIQLQVQYSQLTPNMYKYKGKGVYDGGTFYLIDRHTYWSKDSRIKYNLPGFYVYFAPPYLESDTIHKLGVKYKNSWNIESRPIMEEVIIRDLEYYNLLNVK